MCPEDKMACQWWPIEKRENVFVLLSQQKCFNQCPKTLIFTPNLSSMGEYAILGNMFEEECEFFEYWSYLYVLKRTKKTLWNKHGRRKKVQDDNKKEYKSFGVITENEEEQELHLCTAVVVYRAPSCVDPHPKPKKLYKVRPT